MKVVQKILAALLIAAVMGCWMGVVTLADPVDETDQAPTQTYTSSGTTTHPQESEETTQTSRRTTTSTTSYDDDDSGNDYTEYYYEEPSEEPMVTQPPQQIEDEEDDDSQTKTTRATGAATDTEPVTTEKKIINDYGEKYDWLKWLCYITAPLSLIALIVVNVAMHKQSGAVSGSKSRHTGTTVRRPKNNRRRK